MPSPSSISMFIGHRCWPGGSSPASTSSEQSLLRAARSVRPSAGRGDRDWDRLVQHQIKNYLPLVDFETDPYPSNAFPSMAPSGENSGDDTPIDEDENVAFAPDELDDPEGSQDWKRADPLPAVT